MAVRIAATRDRENIEDVYMSAFPEGEGEIVSKLAIDLLSEQTAPPTISLIAETDGKIVGHAAFSPVQIDGAENFLGYILAPLAVRPEYQKQGIGTNLIEYGMQGLSSRDVNVVFVYGDPDYYGRSGFSSEAAHQYTAPYKLQYPFGWQARFLDEFALKKVPVAITCVRSLRDPTLW